MKKHALALAAMGWAVFPLRPLSLTRPADTQGMLAATADPDTVAAWWDASPDANPAIRTGHPSRVIVLCGSKSESLIKLQELGEKYRPELKTLVLSDGTNWQAYLRIPDGLNIASSKLQNIEVKGDGAFVASLGSRTEKARWARSSLSTHDVQTAPGWLLDYITAGAKKRKAQENWQNNLAQEKGRTLPTLGNALVILEHHQDLEGLAYNEWLGRTVWDQPPPWDKNNFSAEYPRSFEEKTDLPRLLLWLQNEYHQEWVKNKVHDVLQAAAAARKRLNVVKDYLNSLRWDGSPRLDTWLRDHFGAKDTPYTRAIGPKWLISGVARAQKPGCKVDTILVFEGDQGLKKSTALKALCPDESLFRDDAIDINGDDTRIKMRGCWIWEVAEFAGARRSNVDALKSFITTAVDCYRPKYARDFIMQPRSCIFAISVNDSDYFVDTTGNRRFWPFKVTRKVHIGDLLAVRDQLWAEAVHRYRAGEEWWLDRKLEREAQEETEERMEIHPWEDYLREFLLKKDEITILDCFEELRLSQVRVNLTHSDQTIMGQVLHRSGFSKVRRRVARCSNCGEVTRGIVGQTEEITHCQYCGSGDLRKTRDRIYRRTEP